MFHLEAYCHGELHQLETTRGGAAQRHREQWLQWQSEARVARRRIFLAWAGDRLIESGERLRSWAEPEELRSEQA